MQTSRLATPLTMICWRMTGDAAKAHKLFPRVMQESVETGDPAMEQLLNAYRWLRIEHQLRYANYKIGQGERLSARTLGSVLGNATLSYLTHPAGVHRARQPCHAASAAGVEHHAGSVVLLVAALGPRRDYFDRNCRFEGLRPNRERTVGASPQ
jgi:hypothetical protein